MLVNNQYVTIISLEKLSDGSSVYFAFHPELPGCMTDGQSPEEARANLDEARRVCLEYLRESGLPIPEPKPLLGNTRLPRPVGEEKSPSDKCRQFRFVFEPA